MVSTLFRKSRVRRCLYLDLPLTGYAEAWELQHEIVNAKMSGTMAHDVLLMLEHLPVFTMGRRGGLENLRISKSHLTKAGIPVVHVERGGDITFHGPGQLVVYPIFDLKGPRLRIVDFVEFLEEVMIQTVARWGIHASRDSRNRGVWVREKKLGSVGIAVRHGISFHGLALNVNTDLDAFRWIHPCGLQDVAMTSMAKELSREVDMSRVRETMTHWMERIFELNLHAIGRRELSECLKPKEGPCPREAS